MDNNFKFLIILIGCYMITMAILGINNRISRENELQERINELEFRIEYSNFATYDSEKQ